MMLRQWKRLHSEEQGMALVVSLMVAFVILMLSSVVVAQSIHSLDASGYDRQRLSSYNAAEAGVNAWWEDLQTTALASLSCTTKAGVMNTQPNEAQYSADITFYAADGSTAMSCPLSSANPPSYVKVVSTGSSEGEASRQVETFAKLTPVYTGFGAAIMSVNGTSFGNNFEVFGDAGSDGDIYILNGNLSISNSPVIWGSVYVPNGSLSMSNSSQIKGNVWAKGSASLTSVGGWAKSTTGNISGGSVGGDATAAGTITSSVAGTKYPGTNPGTVPTQTFPQIANSTTAWTNAGYTLVGPYTGSSACTNAYNYIHNTGSGTWATSGLTNIVVQINATCTFSNGNNDTVNVRGNLAVISDGAFTFSQHSDWNGSSTVKSVYFISGYTSTTPCPSTKNIAVGNNTNFNAFVNVFFYTPCTATLDNTNNFIGQALAGTANIGNQFTMTYKPVLVPGQGTVTGFSQDIAYVREI
jgi:Tfp pilus assembly protein PilX